MSSTTNLSDNLEQDNELFELCKEVYEKTGWFLGVELWFGNGDPSWRKHISNSVVEPTLNPNDLPLYTSDYLLEKLPKTFSGYSISLFHTEHDDYWVATYGGTRGYKGVPYVRSRKYPLKALLKLTKALAEAGEI